MTLANPLAPLPDKAFDVAAARHLLSRAGFGGPPVQVALLQNMGLGKAVDYLVNYQNIPDSGVPDLSPDPNIIRPPTAEEKAVFKAARDSKDRLVLDKIEQERNRRRSEDAEQAAAISNWWLTKMIATPRPLEEKLTLLWHGHFASNQRTVQDSYLMFKQNVFLRRNANGNFATLAQGIVRDPAMIKFLNNDSNNAKHPNENLARELMELFTLGVGNYTENDIKEGAKALTGYNVDDNDFIFRRYQHDYNAKTIFGKKDNFDGDSFAAFILQRPECAYFIAYKLYKHFVGDIDDQASPQTKAYIMQLAGILYDNHYELKPVLTAMFKSSYFYDPSIVGNQIKSPAQVLVGTIRALNTPTRDIGLLTDAMNMMGQKLFDPPSVKGWDGGRSWINTSTLFVRQNLCAYLITGKLPFEAEWNKDEMEYDPMFLLKAAPSQTPEGIVDHLMATLIGPNPVPVRREKLIGFLKERKTGMTQDVMTAMLLLVTACPEYQLC